MVAGNAVALLGWMAAAEQQPLWLRLSPAARLRALLGLVVIVTLGLLLILFIRSFGRFMRSYSRPERPADPRRAEDDWAQRPAESAPREEPGQQSGDEPFDRSDA